MLDLESKPSSDYANVRAAMECGATIEYSVVQLSSQNMKIVPKRNKHVPRHTCGGQTELMSLSEPAIVYVKLHDCVMGLDFRAVSQGDCVSVVASNLCEHGTAAHWKRDRVMTSA